MEEEEQDKKPHFELAKVKACFLRRDQVSADWLTDWLSSHTWLRFIPR